MTVHDLMKKLLDYPLDTEVKLFACGNGEQKIKGLEMENFLVVNGKLVHGVLYINGEDYPTGEPC